MHEIYEEALDSNKQMPSPIVLALSSIRELLYRVDNSSDDLRQVVQSSTSHDPRLQGKAIPARGRSGPTIVVSLPEGAYARIHVPVSVHILAGGFDAVRIFGFTRHKLSQSELDIAIWTVG